MKKLKVLLITTLVAIAVISVGVIVYATASGQDGLYAEIITDKEKYSENEDINITIRLENKNINPIENISVESLIPDELTLKSGQANKEIGRLEPNEKIEMTFVAIKKGQTEVKPTEQTTTKEQTIQNTVKRKIKVKSIKLNKKKVTLRPKQTVKLKAKIKPLKATNKKIKWSSTNKKVAKVNSKGKVTALRKGKAKIYAKAKDGSKKKAVCKVIVKKNKKKNKKR